MRVPISLAMVLTAASGCLGGGVESRTPIPIPDETVYAPWWPVGAWWDLSIRNGTESARSVRLVHFWNDSATSHFWLGVADRNVALDHALHDTNPLVGRVHWELLTPHEKGIHANGMFTFPIRPGDAFGGIMFGREWSVQSAKGPKPGSLLFSGNATDGARVEYDYEPTTEWFSFVDIQDRAGRALLRIDVQGHGAGATGTYYFHRGRDYHEGPTAQGTHDEKFEVEEESPALATLAVEFKGSASAVLRIDLVDPGGTTRHTETLVAGPVNKIVEVATPTPGMWTLKYVGTGTFDGRIEAVGITEYTRTL